MQCPRCQQENRPQAKFCEECGARLTLACAQCGTELSAGAKFCPECGTPTRTPPTAEPRFASPDAYTPKHLAEKILTSRTSLEGERKQVTVLFADLKGSMELLADRDPEEARTLLDPVLVRMMEAVHRYEGTVNQVMGDGIMALFGAPVAHEDHAVRACYAALDMQAAIRRYAEETRRSHGVEMQVRVGLNSGEVVVRAIGSDLRMDYSAIGQTTHLAARMEQIALPGSIRVTADTLRLAEGYVAVRPLGPVPVKGLETPVEVYEMVGAGPRRSRLHAAAARGLTRFVGRDRELERLREALSRAATGHGQVVAIVGEPGVGKSRLAWEITHSYRTHGWLIVQASSVSYGKATPHLPVIDLLKGYFQVEDRDDQRKVREKVTGKLLTLDRALEPTLAAVLSLLDVPVEDSQWQALDPLQRRQRTLDAVKRLFLRESQIQPLLVVFEDLHWIDTETQALLDTLIDSVPTARILLLVNYRPEYEHRWGSKTYYTQLRLDPLPPESAEELLQALLGTDTGFQPLKQLLIERTEGNPFFLEESVRTLVETGVLTGDRGAYRLSKPVGSIQVPATVQAVLAARIDRLPQEEKALLQTAAVIGKDVPFALLHAIAPLPEDAVRRALAHLQSAEFLYEARLFPDLEYTFKHALTHEVAYQSLLGDRRRALHAQITDALERLCPDRLGEYAEALAHHAYRGEVWDKSLSYFRQAGSKAALRSAHREAVVCFEQALAALAHCPHSREMAEQAVDLRLDLRNALYPLGESDRILDHLEEADVLARALDDRRRRGWVAVYLGTHFWHIGDNERAVESGQRALDSAGELDDVALRVQASSRLGWIYHVLGAHERAIDLLTQSLAPLEGSLAVERLGMPALPSVMSRTYLTWSLAELGRFAEGAGRAKEGVRIAEKVGEPLSRIAAYTAVGSLRRSKGDLGEAIPVLERARALCQDANIVPWLSITASELGYAYALSGRLGEALPLLEQCTERVTGRPFRALWIGWLGEGYLLAGRLDEAAGVAGQALDFSRTQKERGYQAWAARLVAEIAAHRDPSEVEQAEASYRDAWALANELGMRPLLAHCHLGLGKLYVRSGRHDLAREQLTTATTMYREMDMGFWLQQAEAALKEGGEDLRGSGE
ncbi:MAG: AAA family ATPase [Candidatus Rokubacteria bacterium]|nr:AAA family ATPase [Candidatus Rokubacteria bacterium]